MSRGFQGRPAENPNNCLDTYAPSFWLGKPGALALIRMPDAGIGRTSNDNFAIRALLDGQSVDRSAYLTRTWTFNHQWLTPDVMSMFMEFATRQRGIGPFILIDPQMKNLLSPNQASGTDSLHTTEGFTADTTTTVAAFDLWTRSVSPGWGTATSGQAWSSVDPVFSATGVAGRATHASGGLVLTTLGGTSNLTDVTATVKITIGQKLTGTGAMFPSVLLRFANATNHYHFGLYYAASGSPTGFVGVVMGKTVAGVFTSFYSNFTADVYNGTETFWLKAECIGSTIRIKVWRTTVVEPAAWTASVTDATFTTGSVVGHTSRDAGVTNVSPFVEFDDLTVYNNAIINTLTSSTSDSVQGERSLSWTLSPPVTGTASVLHLVPQTGLYGFCIPPGKRVALSGWAKIATGSPDSSVVAGPALVWMNGVGAVQSTVTGSTVTAVSGSAGIGWQQFCVTGLVPTGSAGVYLDPQILATNSTITSNTTLLFDQLQLEITDTGCTQWEYGQGQPLVGVRSDGESVPRILRTNMNYIVAEVT